MPQRRFTQFRTATTYQPRRERDRFDHVTMAAAVLGTLAVNVFITVPVMSTLGAATWNDDSAYMAWILICLSANLAVLRTIWVAAQWVVRPWLFDREQQNNEIVPPTENRSRTRA